MKKKLRNAYWNLISIYGAGDIHHPDKEGVKVEEGQDDFYFIGFEGHWYRFVGKIESAVKLNLVGPRFIPMEEEKGDYTFTYKNDKLYYHIMTTTKCKREDYEIYVSTSSDSDYESDSDEGEFAVL